MQALKRVAGVALAAELAGLGAGYYAFHRLNTDAEFRAWVGANAPETLEAICASAQTLGYDLPDLVEFRRQRARGGRDATPRPRPSPARVRAMTPSADERLQEELWRGAIPVEVHLASDEVATADPPPPVFALVPRAAYLPVWHDTPDGPGAAFASALPPGRGASPWFDHEGLPPMEPPRGRAPRSHRRRVAPTRTDSRGDSPRTIAPTSTPTRRRAPPASATKGCTDARARTPPARTSSTRSKKRRTSPAAPPPP